MSDFTEDLVGAKKVEVLDEKGKVIRTEKLTKPNPPYQKNPSEPRQITMSYIKSALFGQLIVACGISYYLLSAAIPASMHTQLLAAVALVGIAIAAALWYGIGKLRKWAWMSAVALLIIGIPLDLLLFSLATIVLLIYDVLVLYYFRRKEIKSYFGIR